MRNALRLFLVLLPLAASAANPRSVALTIQENGNAQISETQDIAPPGPDGLLRIAPLPETLWPASVTATPIERGETIDILSQRFAYDLLDDTALFRAYRGESITCRKGGDTFAGRLASLPDFSSAAPSLVLAADGQPVRIVPNIWNLDSVEFPARPDLARAPALVWQTAPGQAAPAADQPAIVEAKQSLEALGVQVTALQLDLSQVDAVDELYAAAAGRPIDALRPTPAMVWDTPSWIRTGTTSCTS